MAAIAPFRISSLGKRSGEIFQNSVRYFMYRKEVYRGIYKTDGVRVYKDELLVRQGREINYYPGLNVASQKKHLDHNLVALCDGTVYITTEDVNPKRDFFILSNKKNLADSNIPLKKLTFNVVPDKEIGRFRLQDAV